LQDLSRIVGASGRSLEVSSASPRTAAPQRPVEARPAPSAVESTPLRGAIAEAPRRRSRTQPPPCC
jgi:hypothetical protein